MQQEILLVVAVFSTCMSLVMSVMVLYLMGAHKWKGVSTQQNANEENAANVGSGPAPSRPSPA